MVEIVPGGKTRIHVLPQAPEGYSPPLGTMPLARDEEIVL
jgi:hypothetical protein